MTTPKYVANGTGILKKGTPVYPLNVALLLIQDDAKRGRAFLRWKDSPPGFMFAYNEKTDAIFSKTTLWERLPHFYVGDFVVTSDGDLSKPEDKILRKIIEVKSAPGHKDTYVTKIVDPRLSRDFGNNEFYEEALKKADFKIVIDEEE